MLCGPQISILSRSLDLGLRGEIWAGEITLGVTEEQKQLSRESVGGMKIGGPLAFKASPCGWALTEVFLRMEVLCRAGSSAGSGQGENKPCQYVCRGKGR